MHRPVDDCEATTAIVATIESVLRLDGSSSWRFERKFARCGAVEEPASVQPRRRQSPTTDAKAVSNFSWVPQTSLLALNQSSKTKKPPIERLEKVYP